MISPAAALYKQANYCKTLCCISQQTRFYSLANMTDQPKWKVEKSRILSLPLAEKRKLYKNPQYIIVDKVDPWCNYVIKNKEVESKKHNLDDLREWKKIKLNAELNKSLAEKVSIFKGDITTLEVNNMPFYFIHFVQ